MHNEFTSLIEQDGEWFVASCPEVPEANGQGPTIEDCKQDLAQAIAPRLADQARGCTCRRFQERH